MQVRHRAPAVAGRHRGCDAASWLGCMSAPAWTPRGQVGASGPSAFAARRAFAAAPSRWPCTPASRAGLRPGMACGDRSRAPAWRLRLLVACPTLPRLPPPCCKAATAHAWRSCRRARLPRSRTLDRQGLPQDRRGGRRRRPAGRVSETWLAGYPYWDEGWNNQSEPWMQVRETFFDNALRLPSPQLERLAQAAAQRSIPAPSTSGAGPSCRWPTRTAATSSVTPPAGPTPTKPAPS